jgi:hypothetical protein
VPVEYCRRFTPKRAAREGDDGAKGFDLRGGAVVRNAPPYFLESEGLRFVVACTIDHDRRTVIWCVNGVKR